MSITVETSNRTEVIDVTNEVNDALPEDVESGVCTVFVPHTTASVVVNEAEERLREDVKSALDLLIPSTEDYEHDQIDDNADAHLRSMLLGSSVTIPIESGTLSLGTWQSVLFVEADGPRRRRAEVTVISK